MKFPVLALLLASTASAFVVAPSARATVSLQATAAKSKEEDLELTREVIARFAAGGAPEEKEEPKEEAAEEKEE